MRHRMLLIYNPRAGKGQFLEKLGPVVDMFVKGGYTVEVYPTRPTAMPWTISRICSRVMS